MAHRVSPVCCRGPHLRRITVHSCRDQQQHALVQQMNRDRERKPLQFSSCDAESTEDEKTLDMSVLCDDLPRAGTRCSRKRSSPLGAKGFPSSPNTRRWEDGHRQVSCLANAIIRIISIPPHPRVPFFLEHQQLEVWVLSGMLTHD